MSTNPPEPGPLPAEAPEPGARVRRSIPIRPADLPFFYLLLLLHAGILIALPIGVCVLAPFVRRLVALGSLPGSAPVVFLVFTGVVEIGFAFRARAVWRRLRAVTAGR